MIIAAIDLDHSSPTQADAHGTLDQRRFKTPVPWPIAVPGDQANWAFGAVADYQPLNLSDRQTESPSGLTWLQISVDNRLNTLQSIEFSH